MSAKIGEMLVSAGRLKQKELEEALRYQVIFGGKLGTNLIELGYLDEEAIAYFLSEKLGVPYVQPDKLNNIPPYVINAIPREMAKKYKIIPLSIEKKRLSLIMADPSDLTAIDEISFRTDLTITPLVAPELRIILALERYYHLERDVRYIPIIERVEKKKVRGAPRPEVKTIPAPAAQDIGVPEEYLEEAELVETEVSKTSLESHSIDALSRGLAGSHDREEIADLIVEYFGKDFDGVAIFIVKGASAVGWKASRKGKIIEGIENFHMPFTGDSVLKTVAEGKSYYLGPIGDRADDENMVAALKSGMPLSIILVPVRILGKVVSILYVDGGETELADRLAEIQSVAYKMTMALEILILKNKITMT